jgi:hypothetical protein
MRQSVCDFFNRQFSEVSFYMFYRHQSIDCSKFRIGC